MFCTMLLVQHRQKTQDKHVKFVCQALMIVYSADYNGLQRILRLASFRMALHHAQDQRAELRLPERSLSNVLLACHLRYSSTLGNSTRWSFVKACHWDSSASNLHENIHDVQFFPSSWSFKLSSFSDSKIPGCKRFVQLCRDSTSHPFSSDLDAIFVNIVASDLAIYGKCHGARAKNLTPGTFNIWMCRTDAGQIVVRNQIRQKASSLQHDLTDSSCSLWKLLTSRPRQALGSTTKVTKKDRLVWELTACKEEGQSILPFSFLESATQGCQQGFYVLEPDWNYSRQTDVVGGGQICTLQEVSHTFHTSLYSPNSTFTDVWKHFAFHQTRYCCIA